MGGSLQEAQDEVASEPGACTAGTGQVVSSSQLWVGEAWVDGSGSQNNEESDSVQRLFSFLFLSDLSGAFPVM